MEKIILNELYKRQQDLFYLFKDVEKYLYDMTLNDEDLFRISYLYFLHAHKLSDLVIINKSYDNLIKLCDNYYVPALIVISDHILHKYLDKNFNPSFYSRIELSYKYSKRGENYNSMSCFHTSILYEFHILNNNVEKELLSWTITPKSKDDIFVDDLRETYLKYIVLIN